MLSSLDKLMMNPEEVKRDLLCDFAIAWKTHMEHCVAKYGKEDFLELILNDEENTKTIKGEE